MALIETTQNLAAAEKRYLPSCSPTGHATAIECYRTSEGWQHYNTDDNLVLVQKDEVRRLKKTAAEATNYARRRWNCAQ